MQAVNAMGDRSRNGKWNLCRKQKEERGRKEKNFIG